MSENEAIKALKLEGGLEIIGKATRTIEFFNGLVEAEKALSEIQQYRAIGTVERFEQLSKQFAPHNVDETSCHLRQCNKCDMYRKENEKYHEIGTIEELQALKEKNETKEPIKIKTDEKILYMCPSCRKIFIEAYDTVQRGYIPKFCEMCGQDIKCPWGQ